MTNAQNNKLTKIESMIAYQEKIINDLNHIVIEQGKEIDSLKKYIKIKFEKIEVSLESISEKEHTSISEEALANKPPHY